MSDSCVMVFTSRSTDEMLAVGGSQAWKLGTAARKCSYLVCTWNTSGEYAQPNNGLTHGEAFLVAPITSIEAAALPEDPQRCIIRFRKFARLAKPNVWNGQRNPVAYTTLRELGINPEKLRFEPAPEPSGGAAMPPRAPSMANQPSATSLTIAQAKEALAATYGVQPQSVEITIRG